MIFLLSADLSSISVCVEKILTLNDLFNQNIFRLSEKFP